MKLTTLATVFVLLVLTTCVCCQDEPGPEIENEVEKEVGKEVDNKIDNALETVCQKDFIMKPSTLATTLALLVLATFVCCQDDVVKEIENEVAKEVESTVDDAAATVCQAFPIDDPIQDEHQPAKRGFFSKLWKGVKTVVIGAAVSAAIGKRDRKPWKTENDTLPEWRRPEWRRPEWRRPWRNHWWRNRTELVKNARDLQDENAVDLCEPEYQSQIEKLEKAIEVLGTMTHFVQSLKKCNEPVNSP
ncbi:unnamed protein product [Lymnaea stagnalis]|uniref:Uncharacterized protein n=1 Tax=Lymnaea stagnalis TaxID=6523 RepID=A0AAV2HXP2_LYMST